MDLSKVLRTPALDSSRFLEATNAVATGLSLLPSMPMVPGTVTVTVLSSPRLGGPARSPSGYCYVDVVQDLHVLVVKFNRDGPQPHLGD